MHDVSTEEKHRKDFPALFLVLAWMLATSSILIDRSAIRTSGPRI